MAGNTKEVAAMEEIREAVHGDIDYLTIGKTTYEIVSVYAGKVTLLDLVKSSLKRSAQQAIRQLENP